MTTFCRNFFVNIVNYPLLMVNLCGVYAFVISISGSLKLVEQHLLRVIRKSFCSSLVSIVVHLACMHDVTWVHSFYDSCLRTKNLITG